MPKNSTDLSLEILEKVDGFYSESFEKLSNFYSESFQNLILYIAWFGSVASLLILVGLPFLIQAIQKKFFKVESQEIKKSLHEELTKELELEIKKISKEYREKEIELEKQLKDLDNKRKRDVKLMKANIYEMKADIEHTEKRKFSWQCLAAQEYLEVEGFLQLSILLDSINQTLPSLKEKDILESNDVFENFIQKLKNRSDELKGMYFSEILDLEEKFKKAKERKS